MQEFREIFNLVDSDGSGEISREELGDLIATLGLKVPRAAPPAASMIEAQNQSIDAN